jgi:small GTP-binding protein
MSYKTITEFDHIFRVLFVGDDSVGKTSLLQRYVEHTFSDMYMPTIGIDFKISTVKLNKKVTLNAKRSEDKVIKLQLYDTGGGDHFRSIVSAYYPNADAIVIVYDISDIDSFSHVERWLHDALHNKKNNLSTKDQSVPKFLIGNKTDLPSYRRAVSSVAGETLARQHGMIFFETSAKNKVSFSAGVQSSTSPEWGSGHKPDFPLRGSVLQVSLIEDIFVEICKECLLHKIPSERGPLLHSFESTSNKEPDVKTHSKYCFCC